MDGSIHTPTELTCSTTNITKFFLENQSGIKMGNALPMAGPRGQRDNVRTLIQ